jgi:hypothetical protein
MFIIDASSGISKYTIKNKNYYDIRPIFKHLNMRDGNLAGNFPSDFFF